MFYNAKTGKFDKAAIMKEAWARTSRDNNIRLRFGLNLSVVWMEANQEKAAAGKTEIQTKIADLNSELAILPVRYGTRYTTTAMADSIKREIKTLEKLAA